MPALVIGIHPEGPPMPPGSKKSAAPRDASGGPPPNPSRMKPQSDKPQQSQKASPEEAGSVRANDHCRNCVNYMPSQGECQKVAGQWMPDDACVNYFQAAQSSGDDNDPDDTGGQSENDQDDNSGGY